MCSSAFRDDLFTTECSVVLQVLAVRDESLTLDEAASLLLSNPFEFY